MASGGWTLVRNNNHRRGTKRGSHWAARRGKEAQMDEEVSNFFFIELLKELCAKDLFEIFKGYGLVLEVEIPPKRDNKGRRYNFVRFRKVNNERELAIKLDNIFIRGSKLYANIPRFNRVRRDYVEVDQVGVDVKGVAEVTYKGDGYREDGKNSKAGRGETSYVNVVK